MAIITGIVGWTPTRYAIIAFFAIAACLSAYSLIWLLFLKQRKFNLLNKIELAISLFVLIHTVCGIATCWQMTNGYGLTISAVTTLVTSCVCSLLYQLGITYHIYVKLEVMEKTMKVIVNRNWAIVVIALMVASKVIALALFFFITFIDLNTESFTLMMGRYFNVAMSSKMLNLVGNLIYSLFVMLAVIQYMFFLRTVVWTRAIINSSRMNSQISSSKASTQGNAVYDEKKRFKLGLFGGILMFMSAVAVAFNILGLQETVQHATGISMNSVVGISILLFNMWLDEVFLFGNPNGIFTTKQSTNQNSVFTVNSEVE
jgi:hypothetical protein